MYVGTALLLLWAAGGCADETKVPRNGLLRHLRATMPSLSCEHEYFTRCFNVSHDECEKPAKSAIDACLEEFADDIPEELTRSEGERWAEELGICAGAVLEAELADRKNSQPKCTDASTWFQPSS
jgi:hypothetical protein